MKQFFLFFYFLIKISHAIHIKKVKLILVEFILYLIKLSHVLKGNAILKLFVRLLIKFFNYI